MRKKVGLEVQNEEQALWRSVIRSTGTTLLWVLILLVLGGMYLAVSAKTASAGRAYLDLEEKVEQADLRNSDLVVTLAELTSPQRMMELSSALGFRPATLEDVDFVLTEEVVVNEAFTAPQPDSSLWDKTTVLSPAYTETLVDFIKRWLGTGDVK
jgi:cell division protein FtsL